MAERSVATVGIVFLYNLAVVLSGIYATRLIATDDRVAVFAIGIAIAVGWTLYFQYAMVDRIARLAATDTDGEPAEGA